MSLALFIPIPNLRIFTIEASLLGNNFIQSLVRTTMQRKNIRYKGEIKHKVKQKVKQKVTQKHKKLADMKKWMSGVQDGKNSR